MEERTPPTNRQHRDEKSAATRRNVVGRTAKKSRPDLPQAVGVLFRAAREAQRLSQEQVAELTRMRAGQEVSRAAVSDIERGRCLPGLEALMSLSRVLHIEPAEVLERVDLHATVPVDVTDFSLEDLLRRGEELLWAGDYRGALALYDAMLERLVLSPPDDETQRQFWRARIEINRAVALRRCSAMKAAQATAQRGVELSEGIPALQAEAYMALNAVLSHEGLLTLARVASDQAIALAADTSDRGLQGRAWNQRGNTLYRMGRPREARQAFLEARKLLKQTSRYDDQIKVEGNIGACLLALGRCADARRRFQAAVELARKYHEPAMEASWLIELGRVALDDGNHDEAESCASAALRISKPTKQHLTIFRAEWLLHLIALKKDPQDPDRHRLAYLRRLYVRVREHKGLNVIKEFESVVLRPEGAADRRSS